MRISCALILALTIQLSANSPLEFTIKEQLGQSYSHELIYLELDNPVPEAAHLIGPLDTSIPYQISGKQIFFISEPINELEEAHYRLTTIKHDTASNQLKITAENGYTEVDTGLIAARFPRGGGKGAIPPLLGLRLSDNQWSPESKWQNAKTIQRWSSEVLESGPVFIRIRTTYYFEDLSLASFTATVIAGDTAIHWRMATSGDHPDSQINLRLAKLPGITQVTLPKGYGQWAKRDQLAQVKNDPDGMLKLSPNTSLLSLFPNQPSHVIFNNGQQSLELASESPGEWVNVRPQQTYYGQSHWTLPMIGEMWQGWQTRGAPIVYGEDGSISLNLDLSKGAREWCVSNGAPKIGLQLAKINTYTLDWPQKFKHPLLFLDEKQIEKTNQQSIQRPPIKWAALGLTKPKYAIKELSKHLGYLGNFDVMRNGVATAALYDMMIDSDALSENERRLFRAQMAYLGYLLADPMCWSAERGYGSGNPNMHCSYILTLGIVACVLRDHPKAEEWAQYASDWLDHWLETEVGSNGEWIPEGSHYGNVSLEIIISFAIASQRAGYRDFTDDLRLKKLIAFFAKMHTPPDPERNNRRSTANYGRGTSGEQLATIGIAAKMTAESDPAFSAAMQWTWAQTGYPIKIGDNRLGGLSGYYLDANLPQSPPNWTTESFPQLGVIFRAGFNTPHESFVNFLAGIDSIRNLDVWTPSVTDIAQWYARGQPLSTCFTLLTGTRDRHELLSEGVQLARNFQPGNSSLPFGYYSTTDFSAFVALPGMDYARTQRINTTPDNRKWLPPDLPAYPKLTAAQSDQLTIERQVAFIREDSPQSPAYIIIRDTTRGGEPTVWQFWTLTNGLSTMGQTVPSAGSEIQSAQLLPKSERYSAKGQFGVDLEYFIASPSETPRHTLRYGGKVQHTNRTQYQDLLHLQLPEDGAYFVALYPRLPNETAPKFQSDRTEHIICLDYSDGQDYIFLSADSTQANLNEATFRGTAACAKIRGNDRELSLAAEGEIQLGDIFLKAAFPISLQLNNKRLTLTSTADCMGGEILVKAPGSWSRVKAAVGPATFNRSLKITLPAGASELIYEIN